jgi:hypothetical protein
MALLVALIPLVFLEVALRLMGIGGSIVYLEDAQCGYLPAPDQRFSTMGHPIRILPNGYRGPVETSDTLFVGDSVTYGTAYVRDEDTFPALLGAYNGGVNGWGIRNVEGFLASRPLEGIRRVVLVIPSCDVLRPYMTLRAGLISTTRPMVFRLEYLLRFIWYGFIKTQPAPTDPNAYDANLAAVKSISTNLASRGIAFDIVVLPYREEALGQTMPDTPHVRRMVEEMRAAGLAVHDLMPTNDPASLYRDTAHLTAEGNRWVAEQLKPVLGGG